MDDDFVNWEDLDLDEVLGEDNWTDEEGRDILGPEMEWGSSGSEADTALPAMPVVENADVDKENTEPHTNSQAKCKRKRYKCPLCDKSYVSTSGFRGHVMKKHNRPDLKAHLHQQNPSADPGPDIQLPPKKLPLTTEEDLKREIPVIGKRALEDMNQDRFLALPGSVAGEPVLQITTFLLGNSLPFFYTLLINYMCGLLVSNSLEADALLMKIHQLRINHEFLRELSGVIIEKVPVPRKFVNLFTQHFLTNFTTAYFARQTELLDVAREFETVTLTKNDQRVLYYISGYVLHALKKRYWKARKNGEKLRKLLTYLEEKDDVVDVSVADWLLILNRGALKTPKYKFYQLLVQVEKWLREATNLKNLNSDCLVNLHSKLSDYPLLKLTWDKLIPECNDAKWIIMDHALALFLKIRGFAVTRLVRKELQKKRKSKLAAGSKSKALRKELKEMNTIN